MLQQDLDSLSQWAYKWQIVFNCMHLTIYITHKALPFPSQYFISNLAIQRTTSAKYLSVIITNNLLWSEYFNYNCT